MMTVISETWPTAAIGLAILLTGMVKHHRTAILIGVMILLEAVVRPILGSMREAGILDTTTYRTARYGLYAVLGGMLIIEWIRSYREHLKGRSQQG